MRRLGTAFGLVLALLAAPAGAEPLSLLVEEQARNTLGPALPQTGELDISFGAGAPGEAKLLSAFWMDPNTGQFIANAVTEAGELHRVTGLAAVIVPLPVPVRRMMPGDVITAEDLAELRLPQARIGAFAVATRDELIGMQVRRMLTEGRPVMVQSVMEPLVIDRGDLVTIRYADGPLQLTAPGRALSDAHRGQEVRIVNLASNTSLVGIAANEGIVEVLR